MRFFFRRARHPEEPLPEWMDLISPARQERRATAQELARITGGRPFEPSESWKRERDEAFAHAVRAFRELPEVKEFLSPKSPKPLNLRPLVEDYISAFEKPEPRCAQPAAMRCLLVVSGVLLGLSAWALWRVL